VTNTSYPRPPADTDDGGSDTSLRLGWVQTEFLPAPKKKS
jgi:hypothetical protein